MKKLITVLVLAGVFYGWVVTRPASAATNTYQVTSSADDVDEDGTTFTMNAAMIHTGLPRTRMPARLRISLKRVTTSQTKAMIKIQKMRRLFTMPASKCDVSDGKSCLNNTTFLNGGFP